MNTLVGVSLKLIELPLGYSNSGTNFTLGSKYKVLDVEGSNFWVYDDEGEKTSISKYRFDLEGLNQFVLELAYSYDIKYVDALHIYDKSNTETLYDNLEEFIS